MNKKELEKVMVKRNIGRSIDRAGLRFSLILISFLLVAFLSYQIFTTFSQSEPEVTTTETVEPLGAGQEVVLTDIEIEETNQNLIKQANNFLENLNFKNEFTPKGTFVHLERIEDKVPETGKFVGVDLDSMEIFLYEDGLLVNEFPVISKGRPGTKWETPAGMYDITYKNPNHFSSIGRVNMPYSMQFYGNFFIHGWPTYPDGTEVSRGYSGGCIRLETTDSKVVFEFADRGTPIYVYENEQYESENPKLPLTLKRSRLPQVTATAYVIADIDTGQVFAQKGQTEIVPIASITKLMTALVANETISYSRQVNITQHAYDTYGNSGKLSVGDSFTSSDLIYPMLLTSSNDAAQAYADYLGAEFFINLMNKQAQALDMTDTSFADPSGLSENNLSTTTDLFKLARYIHNRKNFIFDITTLDNKSLDGSTGSTAGTWENNNPLQSYEPFIGGKNGFTDEARKTLLSLFETNINGEARTIAVIVLGSENHASETLSLLDWLKESAGEHSQFADETI